MRRVLFVILFLGFTPALLAQPGVEIKHLMTLPFPVSYFATGATGELFIITPDNQLKKYNNNGDSVGVFNEVKKFGKLSLIEAQNPWKTILFYEDYETIVLLDKYMSVTGIIRLREKNLYGVKAVTTSYDNGLWIFDPVDSKIKKMDDNGNILLSSTDLRQVLTKVPNPVRIIDNDGLLYLYDKDEGIYTFDYYGAFKSLMPYTGWEYIYVSGKSITGIDSTKIYKITQPVPVASETSLPAELQGATLVSFGNRKLYLLKDEKLSVYNLN
ncbi:MAG: hypothetical protein J5I50_02705 [Chitinophagaceae bacterium]|nr:hypothetical protein [Chitinophagaceae bacterium]